MDPNKPSKQAAQALSEAEITELTKLLNVNDAARVLAVSKRTLQQLTADREIAHIKFGRNVRYDIADLRRFAESRKIRENGWRKSAAKSSAA